MIEQLAIAATGVTAIWLTQSKSPEARRYACLFGLAGQPFWFYAAWQAEQWGISSLPRSKRMNNLPGPGDLGRNGPEIPASIFDNLDDVEMALDEAGIPDYLASILADVAYRGWRDEDAADLMRDLKRHVQPIIDAAEQQACADADDDRWAA